MKTFTVKPLFNECKGYLENKFYLEVIFKPENELQAFKPPK